jgi:hypothetical protein
MKQQKQKMNISLDCESLKQTAKLASDHSIYLIQGALREQASLVQSTYQQFNLIPWLLLFL